MDIGLKGRPDLRRFHGYLRRPRHDRQEARRIDPHRQRHILRKPKRLSLRRQPFRLPRTAQPCVFPPTFPAAPPMTPLFDGKKHFPLDFPGIL